MSIKYKYSLDELGRVNHLAFAEPNFIATDGWKVGDCDLTDALPDIETLHEQKYLDAQALVKYKIDRQSAYPSVGEQLDEIFHNGIDSWKAVIQVTKDKYPKPE
jgi:hypothetical protein|tara:strand:+ start:1050 stop:1361 length:312 start_codon:yes stop_codon:yes gene_type:complete